MLDSLLSRLRNEILLTLFGASVFLSDHHQELVQGPHPGEGVDVSPACHEVLCDGAVQ